MSMKLLGESIDIHGGGLDLQFPHHENELAQSESFTGKPFAKLWLHNGLMKTGDRKMSKSEGNEIVVGLLLKKHRAETLRCLLLSSHYRSPIEYSEDRLLEVQRGLDGFHRFFQRFERIVGESFYGLPTGQFELADAQFAAYGTRFVEHMADDFNTGAALGVLHDLLGALNRFVEVSRLDHPAPSAVAVSDFKRNTLVLRDLSNILGLFQRPISVDTVSQDDLAGPLVEFLIELRNDARKNKDFAMADRIRKKLADLNVTIEDRPGSSGWRRG
jgi:cysteinyl-tRNA synthetase